MGSIPGPERSHMPWSSYPLQYSGLENSKDCIVHGVPKSRTWLRDFHLIVYTINFIGLMIQDLNRTSHNHFFFLIRWTLILRKGYWGSISGSELQFRSLASFRISSTRDQPPARSGHTGWGWLCFPCWKIHPSIFGARPPRLWRCSGRWCKSGPRDHCPLLAHARPRPPLPATPSGCLLRRSRSSSSRSLRGSIWGSVCGFLFHLREVCSEPGLQWLFSRLRRSAQTTEGFWGARLQI